MSGVKRTALIFGASGFTGRHLVKRVDDDANWTAVDARTLGAELRNPASLAAALEAALPDAVINLAALSSVTEGDIADLYAVNSFGWLNLLEALKARAFAGRVIFASSANIYGNKTDGPITEDRPPDPANHYALSKLMAERFCVLGFEDLDIVITRPFNCIGVGQKAHFLVPKLVAHFRERRPAIELGNLDVQRDFIDVRDVADVYALLLDTPTPPPVLHISTGRVHSLRDIIAILETLSGHKIEVIVNPNFIRPNDLRHQQGDTTRLRALAFESRYSIADTLSWMLAQS